MRESLGSVSSPASFVLYFVIYVLALNNLYLILDSSRSAIFCDLTVEGGDSDSCFGVDPVDIFKMFLSDEWILLSSLWRIYLSIWAYYFSILS